MYLRSLGGQNSDPYFNGELPSASSAVPREVCLDNVFQLCSAASFVISNKNFESLIAGNGASMTVFIICIRFAGHSARLIHVGSVHEVVKVTSV